MITSVGGCAVTAIDQWRAALKAHEPGARVLVGYRRRDGARGTAALTLEEDPAYEAVLVESAGGTLTPEQKQFREAWLGAKAERGKHRV